MGLLNKIFRQDAKGSPDSEPPSATRFQDTDGDDEGAQARMGVRRELVRVTLRETMRRHAVPSDWLEVRMLPVVTSKGRSGLHVQLIVKQGQGSLLTYIPAFQSSFMAEVEKFEPRAWDWLLSISWQFAAITSTSSGEEAEGGDWQMGKGVTSVAATAEEKPSALDKADIDEDVAKDLRALFAIRDAALQGNDAPTGFEATRPGGDHEGNGR